MTAHRTRKGITDTEALYARHVISYIKCVWP